ncbi:predicted protein [Micromonas commoda]|uniref:Uncharacterized protein n=1 Tax=Micromonas commoda (strain RCC299 / NOUM17 / CCMP2709) TaxID=296587 RepID=C1E5K4_MICCC|nr:predicted protein [Micromonas commoda]ACO63271.1 predicted protein [Micromonas commoda]|eukprot:XP_002502013.1 predicted protein [Micromonas commoda]
MHSSSVRKNTKKKWGVVNGRSCPILPDVSLERNNEPILPATRNLSHVRVLHCVRRGATARSRRPPASLIMGVPKTKWSPEEEEALRKGVKKYGAGKWRFIQKDPVLGKILNQRSNVDLKDKWRNMYPGHSTADPNPDSVRSRPANTRVDAKISSPLGSHPSCPFGDESFWFFFTLASRTDSSARPASPSQDDDDRKSGSRSRGKSGGGGGRAASDSGGSHHRRGGSAKDHPAKRAGGSGKDNKDHKDHKDHKRRRHEKTAGDANGTHGTHGTHGAKGSEQGSEPYLFLVNGQYRTAEEVTRDAARAVREAERAAAAAEEAAEEAELCEREAWEAERLANELLEEAERQKRASDAAAAATKMGPAAAAAGASTIFAV